MAQTRGIEIQVAEADGLAYQTDVLLLKHAQALYGLDALAVDRIGIDPKILPPVDGFRIFRQPNGLAADAVLFVGVKPIREFSYRDIRRFGYKGLCAVASAVPNASRVAMTLHGVGYGLDEVE